MVNYLYYLLVALGSSFFCIAIVILLKTPFFQLAVSAVKQLDHITNTRLSDSDKDKLILKNLGNLLLYLFLNIFLVLISIILGMLPVYIFLEITKIEADYNSIYFYLALTAGSFILFIFKNKKSDYNYWSKLLHTLVLDHYNLGIYLFKKEVKKLKKAKIAPPNEFVVVTGLARAGTTAMTNLLYENTKFHSISYANMPFLMAPQHWKKLYNPKKAKKKERAHNDNVMFSYTSIEALEEYFFKSISNDTYITDKFITTQTIDKGLLEDYIYYQELFRVNNGSKYLTKNNNFMVRYESIREQNSAFKVVLMFREPLEHAQSLLRQHENFITKQNEDPFTLKYMNWLGHYEFGLNQKVFDFGEKPTFTTDDKSSIDFWLMSWINYYSYILTLEKNINLVLVSYDQLLHSPQDLKEKIALFLNMQLTIEQQDSFKPKNYKSIINPNNELLTKANAIYDELKFKSPFS